MDLLSIKHFNIKFAIYITNIDKILSDYLSVIEGSVNTID